METYIHTPQLKEEIASMTNVVIEKAELLKILKDNKEKHDVIFDAACDGYWNLAKEKIEEKKLEFEKAINEAKEEFTYELSKISAKLEKKEKFDYDGAIVVHFKYNSALNLKYPESHARDYERSIRLVELSVYNRVNLNDTEFERYIMNNWEWRNSFLAANNLYAMSGCSIGSGFTSNSTTYASKRVDLSQGNLKF